jgi:hypothetical protein
MKPYSETHQKGMISIEMPVKTGIIVGDFGIQIAEDGRIWCCINGQAFVRFKPYSGKTFGELSKKYTNHMKIE